MDRTVSLPNQPDKTTTGKSLNLVTVLGFFLKISASASFKLELPVLFLSQP